MAIQRALVTGGAGFIGSHLVDALVADGCEVAVLDNLSTGKRENLNATALLFETDIRSPAVADAVKQFRPDCVFHLAGQSSVAVSIRNALQDAEINILGTINLLQACARNGVHKVVFSSSSAVYGVPQVLPCAEDHLLQPMFPYGVAKAAGEGYMRAWAAISGLSASCLRLGNVFGPRQDPRAEAGVVAIFASRMFEEKQVDIFGTGEQERDYVYVDDVVRAFLAAAREEECETYNIGTGTGTSVNALFHTLAQLTRYPLEPHRTSARAGDAFNIRLDVQKAFRRLGWKAQFRLQEGLDRTLKELVQQSARRSRP